MSTAVATNLARNLDALLAGGSLTARDVCVVAETMAAIQHRTKEIDLVEVVCTAPERYGLPVRTTYATAAQMVQGASEEIIVVGYVFTEGALALVELLAAQAERGVQITIIGNRMREQLSRLKEMWPASTPYPPVFSWEPLADAPLASLHAKLLLCDTSEALSYQRELQPPRTACEYRDRIARSLVSGKLSEGFSPCPNSIRRSVAHSAALVIVSVFVTTPKSLSPSQSNPPIQ